ncbi:CHASE2 domain-containing protein [Pseudoalteromonas sp. SSM20]|uniref:CHASE2 domain-containing protein n=1 Tax=Pseudoalteromonas sp. SSM20 TaxID=3139394 RepID=UPI003BABE574
MLKQAQKYWIFKACLSAFFSFVFVYFFSFTSIYSQLENFLFDRQSRLISPKLSNTDIVLVTIDEASLLHYQTAWPWPLDYHVNMINRLEKAGAKVVYFDSALFGHLHIKLKENATDFLNAVKVSKTPIYIGEESLLTKPLTDFQSRYTKAGAKSAKVKIIPDLDGVVREIPFVKGSLWLSFGEQPIVDSGRIHFVGDKHTFPTISYVQAADTVRLPDSVFNDKIVLVGLDTYTKTRLLLKNEYQYLTPFTQLKGNTMSAIEVHANLIENIRHDLFLKPLLDWQFIFISLVVMLLAIMFFTAASIKKSLLGLVKMLLLIGGVSLLAFYNQVYLPTLSLVLLVFSCYLFYFIIGFRKEQAQRRFIKRAFSRYVSSHVLDDLMNDPDKLELGGERKEITVLFADLAGFTKLSEQLEAEQVADILHEILTALSKIIVKDGGTIDKYIGDEVMAFWGAPVAEPLHFEKAIAAAIEMHQKCEKLTDRLNTRGLPPVRLRMGINSGEAIVGHLGSDVLFDYTCIGDTVNQAARLEGANRLYGTDILIGEALYLKLEEKHQFVLIDDVLHKGKSEKTKVYGYFPNTLLTNKLNLAFSAYNAQDWQRAKQLYNELKDSSDFEILAELFLQRISQSEVNMLSDDKQGESHFKNK